MLQVKSISSLKCVNPSPQGNRSQFCLGSTTARRASRSSTPAGLTLPYWPSSQIGRPAFLPPVRLFTPQRYIPADEPIDLLNVAFENPRKQANGQNLNRKKKGKASVKDHAEQQDGVAPDLSTSYLVPDRKTGLEGLAELRRLCPHRIWNFVRYNSTPPSFVRD